jgi:transposase
VVTHLLSNKPHPEQGYRACLGLIRLARAYGPKRMEAACRRALAFQACTYKSIKSILKTRLDAQPLPDQEETASPSPQHPNIRGKDYYHTQMSLIGPDKGG